MKIISKFHDYYDNAMAHGQDKSVVYQRELFEFKSSQKDDKRIEELRDIVYKAIHREYNRYSTPTRYQGNKCFIEVQRGMIVFCGKVYVFYVIHKQTSIPTEKNIFYDAQSLIDYLVSNGVNVHRRSWSKQKSAAQVYEMTFDELTQPNPDWFIENKITVASCFDGLIKINPCLKDFEFYRVFDSYTAYQELDMWVSGTLAWPQNFMVEVSDKDRINQHGFDPVYGFRTRPIS